MKRVLQSVMAAVATAACLGAQALGTNEKGCLVGGAVGGVAGHAVSGNRTLLGAAVGCGAGILINKERVKRSDARAHKRVASNTKNQSRRRNDYRAPDASYSSR